MHQRSGRISLVAILLAVLTTTAAADSGGQNDANTGGDAGDTRATAVAVALGAPYVNNKLRAEDVDWYSTDVSPSGIACVRARVSASAPTYFALGIESPGLTRTAPFYAEQGRDAVGGLAGMTPLTATLRAAQKQVEGTAKYNFTLERVAVPQVGGDGGSFSDAGESPSTAVPITPGCIGGNLQGLDIKDTYALNVPEGQVVTYTLASASSSIQLALVDAVGNALGPSIGPGEIGSVTLPTAQTVFLSSAQTSSVSDTNYAIGTIVGPEPTSCRPYCVS